MIEMEMTMKRTLFRFAAAAVVMAVGLAAPATAQVVHMANIQGWNVSAVNKDGRRVRCIAVKTVAGRHFKLVNDGFEVFAGINRSWRKEGPGTFQVDRARTPVTYRFDGEYSYFRLNANWQNRVAAGNTATFLLGNANIRFSLVGSRAALQRISQCAAPIPANRAGSGFSGRAAALAAGQNAPAQPAPQPGVQPGVQPTPQPIAPTPQPVTPAPMPVTPAPMPVAPAPTAPVTPPATQPTMPTPAPSVGLGCPPMGTVASFASTETATVSFNVLSSDPSLTLYWLDSQGNMVQLGPLVAGMQTVQGHVGDVFVARNANGDCIGGIMRVTPQSATFTVQ